MERSIYELDAATVAEMLEDSSILFVFPEGGSFPYPDMAGDLDYYGAPIWLPDEDEPFNMEMWGGKYLGFYTTDKGHVEAWVFKSRMALIKATVQFRNVIWRGSEGQVDARMQQTLEERFNDPTRRKKLKIELYKERLYELIQRYPEGYFSGAFLGWMDVLSDHTYQDWKREGLSDEEFEESFGGGTQYDLIHEWYRPTFDDSEGQEENYPPMGMSRNSRK